MGKLTREGVKKPPLPTFFREKHLQALWHARWFKQEGLVTEASEAVIIQFPGVWNHEQGPDFLHARVEIGGELRVGAIELHLHASDWRGHRHGEQASYANVILHVALWRDNDSCSCSNSIPQLILEPYLEQSLLELFLMAEELSNKPFPTPSFENHHQQTDIHTMLEQMGYRCFLSKVDRFQKLLEAHSPDEVLYQGIMTALGYKQNKATFLTLAQLVPYATLKELATSWDIEALLLTVSRWSDTYPLCADSPRMDRRLWRTSHLHPANHPRYRIRSVARLLEGTFETGLTPFFDSCLRSFATLPRERSTVRRVVQGILSRFAYPYGIGEQRGLEILFNVILPFFRGYWREEALHRFLEDLYSLHPPLAENSVTRFIRPLLGKEGVGIRSALGTFGLIELYKKVTQGKEVQTAAAVSVSSAHGL